MRSRLLPVALILVGCGSTARPASAPVEDAASAPAAGPLVAAPAAVVASPPEKRLEWPSAILDPRPRVERGRDALVTEAKQLETLLAATPRESADRSDLLGRRAETLEHWARAEGTRESYERAAEGLEKFIAESAKAPRRDEALYALTLVYDVLERPDQLRRTAYTLLKEYPTSRWVHYAYFEFGELFARAAVTEPDRWQMAALAYEHAAASTAAADAAMAAESLVRAIEAYQAAGNAAKAGELRKTLRVRFPERDSTKSAAQ
ncbi:MAG: hypothetical protein HOO96_44220 [Polyangiaceae bacterium]|nr:hypothetical protein [Polyangiaceae bacterium]